MFFISAVWVTEEATERRQERDQKQKHRKENGNVLIDPDKNRWKENRKEEIKNHVPTAQQQETRKEDRLV